MNELRKCKVCGEEQPLDSFPKAKNQKGREYRSRECKACTKVRVARWQRDNAERHAMKVAAWREGLSPDRKAHYRSRAAERQRVRNAAVRRWCYEGYGGAKCACCGESEISFLSIDHVANNGAVHRKEIKAGGMEVCHWLERQFKKTGEWPKGFQVLCMNCQHGKARNNGICPHQEGSTTIPSGSTAKRPEVHRTLPG